MTFLVILLMMLAAFTVVGWPLISPARNARREPGGASPWSDLIGRRDAAYRARLPRFVSRKVGRPSHAMGAPRPVRAVARGTMSTYHFSTRNRHIRGKTNPPALGRLTVEAHGTIDIAMVLLGALSTSLNCSQGLLVQHLRARVPHPYRQPPHFTSKISPSNTVLTS